MKFKILSLVFAFTYLPISLYYSWKLLEHVKGNDLLWFLWWLQIPAAFLTPLLSKLAEWDE